MGWELTFAQVRHGLMVIRVRSPDHLQCLTQGESIDEKKKEPKEPSATAHGDQKPTGIKSPLTGIKNPLTGIKSPLTGIKNPMVSKSLRKSLWAMTAQGENSFLDKSASSVEVTVYSKVAGLSSTGFFHPDPSALSSIQQAMTAIAGSPSSA